MAAPNAKGSAKARTKAAAKTRAKPGTGARTKSPVAPSAKMDAWTARRQEKRQEKRAAILDAALHLIGDQGLRGFQLQALCADVGFTPAALYRYFPSRDALIVETQSRALEQVLATLTERGDAHEKICIRKRVPPKVRPLARLLLTARDYGELRVDMPAHVALITASLADPEPVVKGTLAAGVVPALGATLALIRMLFDQAGAAGLLATGNADRRAAAYFAAVHGAAQTVKLERLASAFSSRIVIDVARALLLGMGAAAPAISAAARALPAAWRKPI